MIDEINKLKFTLTGNMTHTMFKINNLYKEKEAIELQLKIYKNTIHYHRLSNYIIVIDTKIDKLKKQFVREFRQANKKQIDKYWEIRNKQ